MHQFQSLTGRLVPVGLSTSRTGHSVNWSPVGPITQLTGTQSDLSSSPTGFQLTEWPVWLVLSPTGTSRPVKDWNWCMPTLDQAQISSSFWYSEFPVTTGTAYVMNWSETKTVRTGAVGLVTQLTGYPSDWVTSLTGLQLTEGPVRLMPS